MTNYIKSAVGALAIMATSGMIADFDVSVWDEEIYVTVWSVDDQSDVKLRKDVAAMLQGIDESRVFVNRDGAISV